jgi:hypothetical protein
MEKEFLITTEKSYQDTMIALYELMEKEDLTPEETEQIKQMTAAAEKYEAEYL